MFCQNCMENLPINQRRRKAKCIKTTHTVGQTCRIYKCPHCNQNFSTVEIYKQQFSKLQKITIALKLIYNKFYV